MFTLQKWIPEDKLTKYLCYNRLAGRYLQEHPEKIDWKYLSFSDHPFAFELLEKNPGKMYSWVCSNPSAVKYLEKNPNQINWNYLSENSNAIELLKENPEKINWKHLSINPSIIRKVI